MHHLDSSPLKNMLFIHTNSCPDRYDDQRNIQMVAVIFNTIQINILKLLMLKTTLGKRSPNPMPTIQYFIFIFSAFHVHGSPPLQL